MKTLLAFAVLVCALPASAAQAPSGEEDHKLHLELMNDDVAAQHKCPGGGDGAKCGGAPAGEPLPEKKCGKITFSKKDPKIPKDKDLEYDDMKHSKLDDIDDLCYKKRLVEKKMLMDESSFDKLKDAEKALAKKLAMLDKAEEMIEKELAKAIDEAYLKRKLLAAKRKILLEKEKARSKCKILKSGQLKCTGAKV